MGHFNFKRISTPQAANAKMNGTAKLAIRDGKRAMDSIGSKMGIQLANFSINTALLMLNIRNMDIKKKRATRSLEGGINLHENRAAKIGIQPM